jgi:hypothetical protein
LLEYAQKERKGEGGKVGEEGQLKVWCLKEARRGNDQGSEVQMLGSPARDER